MTLALPLPRIRSRWAVAADLLDETSEAAQHEAEKHAIAADVTRLIPYTRIQSDVDGEVRLNPWPWQLKLLQIFMATRLVVVLKARQLGVSWLAALFALWTAMFRPGQTVLLLSIGQKEADEFLDKVKYIFDRLPDWMRPHSTRNTSKLEFPLQGSLIESLPATEGIGRSRTASLVILDEHGHQRWARQIYLALKPVVEHGRLLSISTANGQGALHSQIYKNAKAKLNGFLAVFIPWHARPGRDAEWYQRERAELGELSDAAFTQEYPSNDREAFIVTGRPVFRTEDLARQPVEEGISDEIGRPYDPGLTVYRHPQAGSVYIIGADVGEGLERSDWSSAGVYERNSMEQVAQLRGRWSPDIYASRLDRLARMYAKHSKGVYDVTCILAVERNNHGHAVLLRLRQLHEPDPAYGVYRARDKRQGWVTSPSTRPVLVDQLEAAVRLGEMTIHDAGTIDQMSAFHWSDDGRAEAQEGSFDDDVLAAGVALQVRRSAFGRMLGVPRQPERAAA